MLNKFRCVMIRVYSFVVVTLLNDSYATVCRSSLIRHGLVLDRLICKLAGHNLITCDLKR